MRLTSKLALTLTASLWAGTALAQDAWLQIEAQPGLQRAREAAADYARAMQDVAGYQLGSSAWHAIVIGPFDSPAAADARRSQLRATGQIPADAFVSDGASYTTQFWPIGATPAQTEPEPVAEPVAEPAPVAQAAADPEAEAEAQPEDAPATPDLQPQSLPDAFAAEALLSREEKIEVQRQLRRQGFYDGPLDGAFGQGTRNAMAAWQVARGQEATGVLTEPERTLLAEEHARILAEEGPLPETPAEARASEALLSAEERRAIQTALQWAGVYDGAIDGAFGEGTRASMADWQRGKGYEVTGVLTTRQRAELFADYNAVLDGLGLEVVRDTVAGIEILMPTARVEFARHAPPFAQYDARDQEDVARVILISQRGDRNTLGGLYDILQTLEIVPEEGPREKGDTSFTLTGQNDDFVSHTEARLDGGAVKGFTLVWPTGDDEVRERLLGEMRRSFTPIPGVVMDDMVGSGADQRIDLVSGLRIRRPELSRSGFYVDGQGTVLTSADVLQECGRITLNDAVEAEVRANDDGGLALLTPKRSLAPLDFARFQTQVPRLESEVAVAGFSFEGVLGAPSLTFGTIEDIRALDGSDGVDRLELSPQPGDVGGPVLDDSGSVLGMLLPRIDSDGRVLPDAVSFAADTAALTAFLEAQGVTTDRLPRPGTMTTDELTRLAADITVLVSCWE